MKVIKRSGETQDVQLDKLTERIQKLSKGLSVDPVVVAKKTADGLFDMITTTEIDKMLIQTSAFMTSNDPDYSKLAGRILSSVIEKEVQNQDIDSFTDYIKVAKEQELISEETAAKAFKFKTKISHILSKKRNDLFEYFGLKTVYDRYLLKHPHTRKVIETPQYFFMRVAIGLSNNFNEIEEVYETISSHEAMLSTPTLFNSGTKKAQMSSCYLLDSPDDSLNGIFDQFSEIANLSKWAGGIGLSYSKVRSRGSLIKGTNGLSNGVVPWLKVLDATMASVNQCFAPETKLFTNNGIKEIKDIKENDLVLTNDGKYRKVTETMRYAQEDKMLEIETKYSFSSIKVTAGHPLYSISNIAMGLGHKSIQKRIACGSLEAKWKDAGKLLKGDYVGIPIPTEFISTELTAEDCYFYGVMLGDGHVIENKNEAGITLGHKKTKIVEFVTQYLERNSINHWISENSSVITVRYTASNSKFKREDFYRDGKKAISNKMAHLNPELTAQILKGLIDTDGGIYRENEIHFYTSSLNLAYDVKYLLLKLEALASIITTKHKAHDAVKATGEKTHFKETMGYDINVPAIEPLAKLLNITPIQKKNWFKHQGMLFSRISEINEVSPVDQVHDLKVEGNECYATVDFLAHNGGKRKGAACVYLESWHPDIMEFLELRDNTGDHESRTHNLNLANWIPDLFMKRVKEDGLWSLFDPKHCTLTDKYGAEFEEEYLAKEQAKKYTKQIKARDLYARMMTTLAQTGNGWMCFKDSANKKSNQTADPENIIHSSNLCLDGDTLVLTSQGPKKISKLVGQEVTIFDGKKWVSINSFKMTNEAAEVLKVRMSNGSEITCTPYHKIPLATGGFAEAKSLLPGISVLASTIGKSGGQRLHNPTVVATQKITGTRPVYCCLVPTTNMFALANGLMTGNCSEILEVTNDSEVAVCNLGSINLSKFVKNKNIDYAKIAETAKKMVRTLDRVIDKNFYPVPKAKKSNNKWRPIGLGIMGLQDVFFMLDIPFDSAEALKISTEIQKTIYFAALEASCLLAKAEGPCEAYKSTRVSVSGQIQPDLWEITSDPEHDDLRKMIKQHGLRNSLLIAIAPTATIASIVGCYECIEPQTSNMFKRETLSGEFLQVNKYLVVKLKELNLWNDEIRNKIITNEGSVQGIDKIPSEIKSVYKTVWEISMKDLIQMAAERSSYIDQSQSLNLFIESPTIGKLSSMYMFVWEKGLKTTYYLRSRPATKIRKTLEPEKAVVEPSAAISCSLENPEACESCQ